MSIPAAVMESIPATPNAVTGNFTAPLVSVESYYVATLATSDPAAAVTAAIESATRTAAKRCNRTFKFGQYTERLRVYRKGFVYPSATPIAQLVSPEGDIQGASCWVGFFLPLPSMPVFSGVYAPQTDVTYWGGMTDQTIPDALARAIAKMAWFLLHPNLQPGLAPGATSVSVNGASMAGDLSQMVDSDPDLRRTLRRFRREQVIGWQS